MLHKMAALYGDYPIVTLFAYAGFQAEEPPPPPIPTEVEAQTAELAALFTDLAESDRRILLDLAHSLKREARRRGL